MLSALLLPFRLLLVVVAVLGALVAVPVVETLRGIGGEWALAFWRVRALVRS
jgi:hypothetical protein